LLASILMIAVVVWIGYRALRFRSSRRKRRNE
jgi:hypothetical protein